MNSNEHILSRIGHLGLTGIYRNKYGSQHIMIAYIANIGFVVESHVTINKFNWSPWKVIHNLSLVDPSIMRDLLNDDYRFNYKEGIVVGN